MTEEKCHLCAEPGEVLDLTVPDQYRAWMKLTCCYPGELWWIKPVILAPLRKEGGEGGLATWKLGHCIVAKVGALGVHRREEVEEEEVVEVEGDRALLKISLRISNCVRGGERTGCAV